MALSGIALWQFWTSLILLGLGWNFGFIGATAMVAQTYRPSEKGKVQGFHDFVLFSSVAFASLMSGAVYNHQGWDMLNWIIFPVVGRLPGGADRPAACREAAADGLTRSAACAEPGSGPSVPSLWYDAETGVER